MTIVARSGLYESRNSSNLSAFTFPTTVAPANLTPAGASMFGNFQGVGQVEWKEGAGNGTYFPGINFVRVSDPQCAKGTEYSVPRFCFALILLGLNGVLNPMRRRCPLVTSALLVQRGGFEG